LRINVRGVGESAGVHDGNGAEEEDARAALNWLAERHPHVECWAAGFSFGSRTVFGLALKEPTIRRLLLVGFPARVYPLDGVDQLTIPTLFIWGDRDEFGTRVDLLQQYPNLPATHALQEIEGADHFFRRFTKELESQVREYAQAALAPDALG
jgi:alpha/beta superfamily hydrolase